MFRKISSPAPTPAAQARPPALFFILFGGVFFAAGCFVAVLYFKPLIDWQQAANWQETPCWILSTELETKRGSDSTTYQVTAHYRYEFDGSTYVGDRVSLNDGADNIGSFQHDAHRKLSAAVSEPEASPPGSVCFVNPQDPNEAVLFRDFRWEMQAFLMVFALTFPTAGASVMAMGVASLVQRRREKRANAASLNSLREQPPNMGLRPSPSLLANGLLWFVVWSGVVIFPFLITLWQAHSFDESPTSRAMAALPVAWLILLLFALRKKFRQRAIGGSRLLPETEFPIKTGSTFAGDLALAKAPETTMEVTLRCYQVEIVRSQKNQHDSKNLIWADSQTVLPTEIMRIENDFRLPFRFQLPVDAPPTSSRGDRKWHEWELEMAAPNQREKLNFPILVVTDPEANLDDSSADLHLRMDDLPSDAILARLLLSNGVQAQFSSDGRQLGWYATPRRFLSTLLFLIVFDLIWTGAAVFLLISDAPLLFKLVWPISATVIWGVVIWLGLHYVRVECSVDQLKIQHRLGPYRWGGTWSKADLADFSHASHGSVNHQPIYRVRVQLRPKGKKTLLGGIKGEFGAKALQQRLNHWLR